LLHQESAGLVERLITPESLASLHVKVEVAFGQTKAANGLCGKMVFRLPESRAESRRNLREWEEGLMNFRSAISAIAVTVEPMDVLTRMMVQTLDLGAGVSHELAGGQLFL
jgi:hypothetical protein